MSLFTGVKGFEEHEKAFLSQKVKRIRYEVPTYIKFYSIYQYDRLKFRELMNVWLKTKEGEKRTLETLKRKQNEILDICYVRDENNKPLRDCDEKHIFRSSILQKLHEQIYAEIIFLPQFRVHPFTDSSFEVDGLIVYPEEQQAELKDTWNMSLKDRVKAHIKVLRKLRENEASNR